MSVCPAPRKARKTKRSGAKMTNNPKTPKYEMCIGGTVSDIGGPGNNVNNTMCCPNPGPQGPAGCALKWESSWTVGTAYNYESGTPCSTSIVTHEGITYIAKTAYTADSDTEPGKGANWTSKWDVFMSSGELRWKGTWASNTNYARNDIVLGPTSGAPYVCIIAHTSKPNPDLAFGEPNQAGTSIYWQKMADFGSWVPQQQKSFLDGLIDGVTDWWKDAPVWQKVLGVAAGVGVAYAGYKVVDVMLSNGDPAPGETADARYTGTPGYNGAFVEPTLPVVVSSIMQFAGYTVDQFDVSQLPAKPVHFSLTSSMGSRALLSQLAIAYQFDVVPSGGKVKFVPKYQNVIRNLTWDDMGHTTLSDNEVSGKAPYTAKRLQGIDLPRSIQLTYYSAALDHNTFTQKAELYTYDEGQDVTLSVPFTMTDDEAMRIAETTMVNSHIEQQEYVFTTDYRNIDLEPGDVITIPVGDGTTTTTVRIKEINETDDGILEFKTSRADYNDTTYVGAGLTVAVPPVRNISQPVSIGLSNALFFELPAMDASDDTPRFYAAVHGYGRAGWPGAAVFKSVDGGNTYSQVANTNAQVTFGMVTNATPAPTGYGYYVWDNTTQISVTLKQGTLNTLSDIAVLNGQNWALVGQELIGFVNATLTGPNTYTLSRLLRGQRGTEHKCGDHLANELFVIIDNNVTEMAYTKDEINKPAKYKIVTNGSSLDKAEAVDVQPAALNMIPWVPAQTKMVKQNNDYVITWVERPRLNNLLQDDRELVHDADWAGYGITIFGDSNMNTVKRSAVVVVTNFTYTEAMQIEDFGAVQPNLHASVIQMSTIVGGGFPAVVTA